ncbi:MAG TPA: hypothetical protein VMH86_01465 [Rhizomicrobium sp.]|nr:hypothetical protein [Rhizomicrobium sp.]
MKRKRFNVWAAYIDLFSNLLVFVAMAGLIAAASGSGTNSAHRECLRPSPGSSMAKALDDLRRASALSTQTSETTGCEIQMLPGSVSSDWAAKTEFLQFENGTDRFCWDSDAPESKIGCSIDHTAAENSLATFCASLAEVLRAAQSTHLENSKQPTYRVAIVGHTSDQWTGQSLRKCEEPDSTDATAAESERLDRARLMCNFKLSLERAHKILTVCEAKWHEVGLFRPGRSDLKDELSERGDAYLDSDLSQAVHDRSVALALDVDKARERRITVTVLLPARN